MTAKQFFKGKAFKCITVLLCVLLVSGVLLAICWGFLEVTDEERFNRKINAMYSGETVTAEVVDLDEYNTKVEGANIQSVWHIKEKKDYLVQAASRGYGGDIVCWVAVSLNDDESAVSGIRKVIKYEVADSAELIGNIKGSVYDKFSTEYVDGKKFAYGTKGGDEYIETGASFTMTAICNCVNGSVEFVKAYVGGGSVVDPLAGFSHTEYIDGNQTTWEANGTDVNYNIVTKGIAPAGAFNITLTVGSDKKVKNYTIVTNGSTNKEYEDKMSEQAQNLNDKTLQEVEGFIAAENGNTGALITGATKSNTLCYSAAAFALANYDKCLTTPKGGN